MLRLRPRPALAGRVPVRVFAHRHFAKFRRVQYKGPGVRRSPRHYDPGDRLGHDWIIPIIEKNKKPDRKAKRPAAADATDEIAEDEPIPWDGSAVRGRRGAVAPDRYEAPTPTVLKQPFADVGLALPPSDAAPPSDVTISNQKQLISCCAAADVLALFEAEGARFNCVNLATALLRLGFLDPVEPALYPTLRSLISQTAGSVRSDSLWDAKHLSNALVGLAKVGSFGGVGLFDAVADTEKAKLGDIKAKADLFEAVSETLTTSPSRLAIFKAPDLANLAWAYATAGFEARPLFHAVAEVARRKDRQFNPKNVGIIAWAFARQKHASSPLFRALARQMIKEVGPATVRDLANCVWAFSTLRNVRPAKFDNAPLYALVAAEFPKKLSSSFDATACADVAWAYAAAGVEAEVFEALASNVTDHITTFAPHQLANISWAYSNARLPAVFAAVSTKALKEISDFDTHSLAKVVWAFAKAGFEAPELFEAVALEASRKMETFKPQELANTVWAYSTMGVEAPLLFEAVAAAAPTRMAAFTPQDIAGTVWAFSKAGVVALALFKAVALEALKRIEMFKPRYLADTVWAYASTGVHAPELFEAVAAQAVKIATFESTDLATTVWAFAKAGVAAPKLFDAVAAQALKKIKTFDSKALADTCWAFTTAGVSEPNRALFQAVAVASVKKMSTFTARDLASTAWAFASAGIEAPDLLEAVAVESSKKVSTFNPRELASTVWAFSTAGVEAPMLFEAVSAAALEDIAAFEAPALARTAWAFAIAGFQAPALFEAIAVRADAEIGKFSHDELAQLHTFYVRRLLEAPLHSSTLLFSRHEAALRAASVLVEPSPSQSQRDVSAALTRIGWAHEVGHLTAEGLLVSMAQPALKVALEFCGPADYFVASPDADGASAETHLLGGRALFKEWLLLSLGWRLLRVPFFEWDAQLAVRAKREAYLRNKTALPS